MKSKTFFAIISIFLFIFSCSPSKHLGRINVAKPPMLEGNADTWFNYYQDQFDAYEGDVIPPDNNYPNAATLGFEKALADWKVKDKKATKNTILVSIGGGIVFAAVIVAVFFTSGFR